MSTLHIIEGTGDARRTRQAAAQVAAAAVANGWTPHVIDLDDLASDLDSTRLVLCGGDGLVHQVVQRIAGRPVEVALVPVGTGNDLARSFGLRTPAAIGLAASAPGSASVQPVDLISTRIDSNERVAYAATVLTAGYSGRVNATANALRFPPGSAKYTVAALREIGRLRPREMRLTLQLPDGSCEEMERLVTFVAIGNTAYFGGGMKICPAADPRDGRLDVVVVGPLGRAELVRWLPRVFAGRHLAHPAVATTVATAVTIETDEAWWADGEPFGDGGGSLTACAAAAALKLVVPREGDVSAG